MKDKYKAIYKMFLLYDALVCQHEFDVCARETTYAMVGRSKDSDLSLKFWFYPSGFLDWSFDSKTRYTHTYTLGGQNEWIVY